MSNKQCITAIFFGCLFVPLLSVPKKTPQLISFAEFEHDFIEKQKAAFQAKSSGYIDKNNIGPFQELVSYFNQTLPEVLPHCTLKQRNLLNAYKTHNITDYTISIEAYKSLQKNKPTLKKQRSPCNNSRAIKPIYLLLVAMNAQKIQKIVWKNAICGNLLKLRAR